MENLESASSGSDFYVLWGSTYLKSLLVIVVVHELDLNLSFNGVLEDNWFLWNCIWVVIQ